MKAFPGNDERMSVLHQDSGGIGKSIPSALEISLGHGFCTPRPSGFPSGFALGKSLGSRGAKPMAAGNLSRFPSTLEISLGLRPREISRVSGNLGRRGWIFQSLPPLGGARIQSNQKILTDFPHLQVVIQLGMIDKAELDCSLTIDLGRLYQPL